MVVCPSLCLMATLVLASAGCRDPAAGVDGHISDHDGNLSPDTGKPASDRQGGPGYLSVPSLVSVGRSGSSVKIGGKVGAITGDGNAYAGRPISIWAVRRHSWQTTTCQGSSASLQAKLLQVVKSGADGAFAATVPADATEMLVVSLAREPSALALEVPAVQASGKLTLAYTNLASPGALRPLVTNVLPKCAATATAAEARRQR